MNLEDLYYVMSDQSRRFRENVLEGNFYAAADVAQDCGRAYRSFRIPKPNGKYRLIEEPVPVLKLIQRTLLGLYHHFPLHPAVHGLGGNSFVENAYTHVESRVIIKLDVEKFFPSTRAEHYRLALSKALEWKQINKRLHELLGTAEQFTFVRDGEVLRLPTGAPTSPMVSSISFSPLDQVIDNTAVSCKLKYTRYIDDLVFSGDQYPPGFQREINQIVKDYGYHINHKKSQVMYRDNHSHEITGVTINSKYGIPRRYRKLLRAELDHYARHHADLSEQLAGKLAYVRQVSEPLYDRFQKYFSERVKHWQQVGQ